MSWKKLGYVMWGSIYSKVIFFCILRVTIPLFISVSHLSSNPSACRHQEEERVKENICTEGESVRGHRVVVMDRAISWRAQCQSIAHNL